MKISHKYNYFYKITNIITGQFYYGVHSTDNIDDGYMGSGKKLHYAFKQYGMENFKKEILKFFDTAKDAYLYESQQVTEELIKDKNCYNLKCGGTGGFSTFNTVCSIDTRTGEIIRCSTNDPLYINGVYIPHCKGKYTYIDNNGNEYRLNINDPKIKELNLHGKTLGKVNVKDKTGKYFQVDINDPRYISGELRPVWFNRKHNKKSIEKQKNTYKQIQHQQKEKNSQYGTCWVYKIIENNKPINKKIKKEELYTYINNGWNKGRKFEKEFGEKVKNGMKH